MTVPSFEEVLTFIFGTVRNRKSAKTTVNKLTELLLEKYELKEITFCSLWDRYYLSRNGKSLDLIDEKYLGKSFVNGQDFYNSLVRFACEILRANGLIIGESNNGLGDYSFLGENFSGKITINLLKKQTSYDTNIKLLVINILKDSYDSALSVDSAFRYENTIKDISYTIQSFNKRIYNNQDPFLTQLEKDLIEKANLYFNNNWSMDELINWSKRIENLNSQIKSLNEELTRLKTQAPQNLISPEPSNLNDELLFKLKQMHPTAFEKFSLELIKSIAEIRGGIVEIFHNGQVGDGGVDGVIEAQKTFGKGKEKVFVQCKRYDKTSIGRPELQAFAGAMLTEDITVGIFITTSSFSKQAIQYVEELDNRGKSIELFDGERIIRYMLKNKIGVEEKVISTFEIDSNYFNKFDK